MENSLQYLPNKPILIEIGLFLKKWQRSLKCFTMVKYISFTAATPPIKCAFKSNGVNALCFVSPKHCRRSVATSSPHGCLWSQARTRFRVLARCMRHRHKPLTLATPHASCDRNTCHAHAHAHDDNESFNYPKHIWSEMKNTRATNHSTNQQTNK